MARFYAEIQGSRGKASRIGTANSGMWAHVRGWDVGVRVYLFVDAAGNDVVELWRTAGSNGGRGGEHPLVRLTEQGPVRYYLDDITWEEL